MLDLLGQRNDLVRGEHVAQHGVAVAFELARSPRERRLPVSTARFLPTRLIMVGSSHSRTGDSTTKRMGGLGTWPSRGTSERTRRSRPRRRDVGRARELRRVLLAYAGFSISEYATWLAVLFYALERGGPQEVGLVAFLLLVPAVLVTPFASYAGDRFRPQRALAAGYAAQSAAMVVVAVCHAVRELVARVHGERRGRRRRSPSPAR